MGFSVHCNELSGFVICGEFLDCLSNKFPRSWLVVVNFQVLSLVWFEVVRKVMNRATSRNFLNR